MTRPAFKVATDNSITELDLDAPQGSLKVMQGGVSGPIERVQLDEFDMYVNEEGKNKNLPTNMTATLLFAAAYGDTGENIVGDVVFTGGVNADGDTVGLDDRTQTLIRKIVIGWSIDDI